MAGTPAEVLFRSCKTHIGPICICLDRTAGDRFIGVGGIDDDAETSFGSGEGREHQPSQQFARYAHEFTCAPHPPWEGPASGEEVVEIEATTRDFVRPHTADSGSTDPATLSGRRGQRRLGYPDARGLPQISGRQ